MKSSIRKMLIAAGGPMKKIKTRDINGNWVWVDMNTGRTTSAAPEQGTIRNNTVNSVGGDVKTKQGRTKIALKQVTSYNNRLHRVHNYADTIIRLKLKRQDVALDKQGEPKIVLTDYTPAPEAPLSAADPIGKFYVELAGLKGLDVAGKSLLWGMAKYAPRTVIGNWGRGYFVGNTFKNSFNGTAPILTSQTTSLLYLPTKLNESGLTSLKFFERKPSKLSEAERAGVPKGERNNINNSGNLEKTVNNIILENRHWLPKETGRFAQKHSSIGSSYRKQYEKLWGKENTDRLTDDLLGKLVLIRNHLIETNIPLKGDFVYVVDGQAQAYRNGQEIGYLSNSYIDNGRALHPEMVKKQGINNAGVSELLYNGTILAENRPIISGSRLLMPEVTTHVWSKYPTRKLVSMEGVHAWPLRTAQERGIKLNYEKSWHALPEFSKLHLLAIDENIRTNLTGLPIYLLSEPSYLPMVKNARIFDISLLRNGYINMDFTPGFAYKQGGKMNILEFLKKGSGIHIKKKNRGKFTEYCGGEVTDACIRKAKASGNPTLVKRATFAANARKWKH